MLIIVFIVQIKIFKLVYAHLDQLASQSSLFHLNYQKLHVFCYRGSRARILVQVTIYRRLLIGRDGHLDQSEAYDIS